MHEWWTGQDKSLRLKLADDAIRQGRKELEWLRMLPAQAAQAVLKQYHLAWRACWEGVRRAPKYYSRATSRLSVDVPQARDIKPQKLSKRYGTVQLPGVGRVKVRTSSPYPPKMTGARVVKEANGWHLVIRGEYPTPQPLVRPQTSSGLDRGVVIPVACSDGENYTHNPYMSDKEQDKLKRLQRKASRQRAAYKKARRKNPKQQPSKRYKKTIDRIAQLHGKVARRRKDFNHKASRAIACRHAIVIIEKLPISNMTKSPKPKPDPANPGHYLPNGRAAKAGLNKSILNEAWGQLASFLDYKTRDRGGVLSSVPAAYSSQECHVCGSVKKEQRENQASFTCHNPKCGWSGNADYNASKVIEKRGLEHLKTTAGSVGIGRGAVLTRKGKSKRSKRQAQIHNASDLLGKLPTL